MAERLPDHVLYAGPGPGVGFAALAQVRPDASLVIIA
jgi:ribosomal protein RSM22 (predicted rRNA methylase)